jgi:hypothetical protein
VFNDRKGQTVIQPPDSNVFKMCANRMLDDQPHNDGQQAYVRPQYQKKVSKPIVHSIA